MKFATKVGWQLLALALMVGACGPGNGGGGGGGGGGGSSAGGGGAGGSGGANNPGAGSGGQSSNAAPRILSLHTNISSMTPSDTLVISVVVTDPDGIDDVIGGNLLTPDSVAAYGAFSTDASEGAYSISLSWVSLNTIEAIDTDAGGTVERTLRVEFFDVEGNTVWRNISVNLGCGSSTTTAACGGTCTPVTSNTNCAACGHSCASGGMCELFQSGDPAGCFAERTSTQAVTCTSLCGGGSYPTCAYAYALYDDGSYLQIGCNVVPAATNASHAFSGMDCLCGE